MPDNFYVPTQTRPIKLPENLKPIKLDMNDIKDGVLGTMEKGLAENATTMDSVSLGDKLKGSAGDILNFGINQYQNFNSLAQNADENKAQTIGNTIQGASLGMKLGGPVGAIAGGAVGLGLGLIDAKKDQNERVERFDENFRQKRDETKADRKDAYNQMQGNQESNALKNIYSNQQKFVNPYG